MVGPFTLYDSVPEEKIRKKVRVSQNGESFLTCETEFVLFLAVLENFVLPMG